MSKVYIVLWSDRHADTTVHPFSIADKAIEFAKRKALECDRFGELEEWTPEQLARAPGWLYYGLYSCEGDSLRVVECEMDAEAGE